MPTERDRSRTVDETRERIVDVAREVLGDDPDAGMGAVAAAAGVVRRTVYGHFPSRADLIRTLTRRAVDEITAELRAEDVADRPADAVWAAFVVRLWPLARRYRVLLALRRGEYGAEIHDLLGAVDLLLADLVHRGQAEQVFARQLTPDILGRLASAVVFSLADESRRHDQLTARDATVTSLLLLGVPEARALALGG